MHEELKEAFDKIQADDKLKKHTKQILFQKTQGYRKGPLLTCRKMATVIACCLFMLLGWGGYSLYFTTTSAISIDVNPSVELNINRFDKVIFVKSYNEDGNTILSSVDIRFLDYREALEHLLADESLSQYLTPEQSVSLTVFGTNEKKSQEMLANLTACTASYENIHCSSCNSEEAAAAHSVGMSFGKYKAFLELQALNPDITPEDIKGLTMRQIRDMINELSGSTEDVTQNNDINKENCTQNSGHGNGCGNGNHYGNNGHKYGNSGKENN